MYFECAVVIYRQNSNAAIQTYTTTQHTHTHTHTHMLQYIWSRPASPFSFSDDMCPHQWHALAFLARAHEGPKRRAFWWKIRSTELSNHGQLRSFPRERETTPPILWKITSYEPKRTWRCGFGRSSLGNLGALSQVGQRWNQNRKSKIWLCTLHIGIAILLTTRSLESSAK